MLLAIYNGNRMSLQYARRVLNQEDRPLNGPFPAFDRNTLKRMAADNQWESIGKIFGFVPRWIDIHGKRYFDWQSCNVAFWSVFKPVSNGTLTEGRMYLKAMGENEIERQKITHPKSIKPTVASPVKKTRVRTRRIYSSADVLLVSRIVWLKTRGHCFYCKKLLVRNGGEPRMVKDHFIPLISKGPDDHSNLVPSCVDCDKLKGGKMPLNLPKEVRARYIG